MTAGRDVSVSAAITASEFQQYPVARFLDTESLDVIRQLLDSSRYPDGEIIVRDGQLGDAVYFLQSGTVEVLKEIPGHDPEILTQLTGRVIFGEVGFLLGRRRSATVRARGTVQLLKLDTNRFSKLLKSGDKAAYQMFHYMATLLATRLHTMNQRMADLMKARTNESGLTLGDFEKFVDDLKDDFTFQDQLDTDGLSLSEPTL